MNERAVDDEERTQISSRRRFLGSVTGLVLWPGVEVLDTAPDPRELLHRPDLLDGGTGGGATPGTVPAAAQPVDSAASTVGEPPHGTSGTTDLETEPEAVLESGGTSGGTPAEGPTSDTGSRLELGTGPETDPAPTAGPTARPPSRSTPRPRPEPEAVPSTELGQVRTPEPDATADTGRTSPASESDGSLSTRPDDTPEPDIESGPSGYAPPTVSPLRVAPGLEGFGTETPGGRGGKVLVVTSRDSTGPGTLHAALTASGNRIVLFDVSGPISMPAYAYVGEGNVSVYGQSAPGDGVYLTIDRSHAMAPLYVHASDVLLQHLRFRPGAALERNQERDAAKVGSSRQAVGRVVFDHCTMSWGTDELLDIWWGASDVTVSNCLMYECLYESTESLGGEDHVSGRQVAIGGGARRVSFQRNVLAFGTERMPMIADAREVDIFNNLVHGYDIGGMTAQVQYAAHDTTANVVANLFHDVYDAPYPEINLHRTSGDGTGRIRLHVARNGRRVSTDPSAAVGPVRVAYYDGVATDDWSDTNAYPDLHADEGPRRRLPEIALSELERTLLPHVGASKPARDAVDERIVRQIRSRTGLSRINLVGGSVETPKNRGDRGTPRDVPWPTMRKGPSRLGKAPDHVPAAWKRAQGLPPGTNATTTDSNGDGYLDIEDWLASLG